jgi:hypothetical protein
MHPKLTLAKSGDVHVGCRVFRAVESVRCGMDRLTKLTLMIVAAVVAMYALLSYARHARAPSLGRSTTEQSSPGFETHWPGEAWRLGGSSRTD